MNQLKSALLAATALACACTDKPAAPTAPEAATAPAATAPAATAPRDVHSFARPDEARVVHLSLDLRADFEARQLVGRATNRIERAPGATTVVLDTRDLVIEGVTDGAGATLTYELKPGTPLLGSALVVTLGPATDTVTVSYRTKPDAAALQWLSPAQTSGREQPFLFSQGQAILTRTWIPTQDSPGIRFTYEATIRAPKALRAVMSAASAGEPVTEGDSRVFRFTMPQKIPAYLVALAVGDLGFESLGPRTGIYAEPKVLKAAAWEFADTEKMLTAAEALYGPYRWERYDILILPPSFPFGGMENPRLTFASPTAIAGDRSLNSLIAHELAHSWSGNLVTNATWSDFWLNEGTTTYFEGRIVEALYGKERAELSDVLGWQDLKDEMAEWGQDAKQTKLWRPLDGEDPDDGISGVPYVKGAAFLQHLETGVGRERFDAFLKAYFDRHAFQSMTTQRFLELVKQELLGGDAALAQKLELDAWAYGTAMPKSFTPARSRLLERVDADLAKLEKGAAAKTLDTKTYSALEWVHFVKNLPRPLHPSRLAELDKAFAFSLSKNSEIRFEWLKLAVKSGYQAAVPALEDYLTRQGRRRLVLPLYEELWATDWGKPVATRIFEKAKPFYHPLTAGSVAEALTPPKG